MLPPLLAGARPLAHRIAHPELYPANAPELEGFSKALEEGEEHLIPGWGFPLLLPPKLSFEIQLLWSNECPVVADDFAIRITLMGIAKSTIAC